MGAFGMAGYHFGRKPTSSSSEAPVSMAEGTMPWQTTAKGDGADEHFKYQYHPGGDRNKTPKDAPSALHSVIVPNVTLPKVGAQASDPDPGLGGFHCREDTNTVHVEIARPIQQVWQGRILEASSIHIQRGKSLGADGRYSRNK